MLDERFAIRRSAFLELVRRHPARESTHRAYQRCAYWLRNRSAVVSFHDCCLDAPRRALLPTFIVVTQVGKYTFASWSTGYSITEEIVVAVRSDPCARQMFWEHHLGDGPASS